MLAGPLTMESAEKTAKYYFYAGFFFLPWLLAANAMYFWRHREQSVVIRRYVNYSILGSIIGLVAFLTFLIAFYTINPPSVLWVIRPRQPFVQQGIFADAIYNQLS